MTPPPVLLTPRTFTVPNFGANQKAVFLSGLTPPTDAAGGNQTIQLVSNNRSLPTVARAEEATPASTSNEPIGCGMVLLREEPVRPTDQALSRSGVLPRFQELAEGSVETFFSSFTGQTITTQKVLEPNETIRCTIFAEVVSGAPVVSRARALQIAEAFDTDNPFLPGPGGIYDQVRAIYGSEWSALGGRDGDAKIVLVFMRSASIGGTGLFGFFRPTDASLKSQIANSNEGEILYLNADRTLDEQLGTIAHEFKHMISYNTKVIRQGAFPANAPFENLSVEEGLAVLAEQLIGYTMERGNSFQFIVSRNYLQAPQNFDFFTFSTSNAGYYGQGYLFFRYVLEHFGQQTITNIAMSTSTGLTNLNQNLAPGFAEVFRRWTVANYVCNLGGTPPTIYTYPSGFRTQGNIPAVGTLPGPAVLNAPNSGTFSTPVQGNWSAAYVGYQNGNGTALEITFTPPANSTQQLLFENPTGTFTSLQN
ncbi:MAG: hypothetical protein AB7S38_07540 [Vulcanimicrobiota bacterium]